MNLFMKTQALLINEMKIILLYEMNHEIEGLFHDVHLGGLLDQDIATVPAVQSFGLRRRLSRSRLLTTLFLPEILL
jgi:hypothetical protein